MTKITKTTTREFDEKGNLVKEIVTEIHTEEPDTHSWITYPYPLYGDTTGSIGDTNSSTVKTEVSTWTLI